MTLTELQTQTLTLLEPKLNDFGFRLVKRYGKFVKGGPVKLEFSPEFYNWADHSTVQPWISIRMEAVETIFHRVSGYESKQQKETPTVVTSISQITRDEQACTFTLRTLDDCRQVSESLFRAFVDVALPFFEQNAKIEAIDKLLNERPENDSIYYTQDLRCYHGAIVAKLNKNSDFDRIVMIYRDRLKNSNDGFYLSDFDRLVEILQRAII